MGNYEDYGKVEFGDERLNKRLPIILDQLGRVPEELVLPACGDPHQAKAVYRFTANDSVTTDAITKITHDVTMGKIAADPPSVLLLPQDTTEINYTNLKETDGLGNIGARKVDMGIAAHSSLAVGDNCKVYGILAQKLWVRPPEEHGKSSKRSKLPIKEKESYKWLETIEKNVGHFPEGTLVVHICDREGDIYELFAKAEEEGAHYLCRRCHDRKIDGGDGCKKLDEFINALPEAGKVTIRVPRDSHTQRKERDAVLGIKHGRCQVMRSSNLPGNTGLPESIEVYVVSAGEIDPPPGQEKIFWQLITNVPTGSFEEAVTRIEWYTKRWMVETFHRTLKSGCKVEELQAETAEKLEKLITIYSIIALEIMELTYAARTQPDESCEKYLTEEDWKVLYKAANKTRTLPKKVPTIQEAVAMIAKLGGFAARKSDGNPGVTVIWRGLTKFYTILEFAALFA